MEEPIVCSIKYGRHIILKRNKPEALMLYIGISPNPSTLSPPNNIYSGLTNGYPKIPDANVFMAISTIYEIKKEDDHYWVAKTLFVARRGKLLNPKELSDLAEALMAIGKVRFVTGIKTILKLEEPVFVSVDSAKEVVSLALRKFVIVDEDIVDKVVRGIPFPHNRWRYKAMPIYGVEELKHAKCQTISQLRQKFANIKNLKKDRKEYKDFIKKKKL